MDQNKDESKETSTPISPTQPPSNPTEPTSTLLIEPLPIQTSNEPEELIPDEPDPEPSKWSNFLVGLGMLMIVGFMTVAGIVFSGIGSDPVGQYLVFGLALLLIPIFGVLSLIFVVGTAANTVATVVGHKSKPSGTRRLFSLLSMVVAIIILLYTGTMLFQWWVIVPAEARERAESQEVARLQIEAQEKIENESYAFEHKENQITKENAITLLNSCQVTDFYYTNQTTKDYGNWGEYSATGIAVTVSEYDTAPYSISIADRLIPELVPIAKNSLKNCDELTIWNDGDWIDADSE